MANLTSNWLSIQRKSVDPFSDVASDITSRLTKIIGSDAAYITGFDIMSYIPDNTDRYMAVVLGPGIAVIQNIVIEFTEPITLSLFSFPITSIDFITVVVEYQYEKTSPAPIATIRAIPVTQVNPSKHLQLYRFKTNAWFSVITSAALITWLESSPDNFVDSRHNTGYIKRSGDTLTGRLYSYITPSHPNELVTKTYVDTVLSGGGSGGSGNASVLDNYVLKAGDTISGPLTMASVINPSSDLELITKRYSDLSYLKITGGVMSGAIINPISPTLGSHLTNKSYVDGAIGIAISNAGISLDHSTLTNLNQDDHTHYALISGNRNFTGAVGGVNPILPNHFATKAYIDNTNSTTNSRIDLVINNLEAHINEGGGQPGVTSHSNLTNLNNDDHLQYILVNGSRNFTGTISGVTPISTSHLTTKGYVDSADNAISSNLLALTNRVTTAESSITTLNATDANILTRVGNSETSISDFGVRLSSLESASLGGSLADYIKRDGTSSFTGTIIGVAPTQDNHLTTYGASKLYTNSGINTLQTALNNRINSLEATLNAADAANTNLINTSVTNLTNYTDGQVANLTTLLNTTISALEHDSLLNRENDIAHPQYLLLAGGVMTGNISVLTPTAEANPINLSYFNNFLLTSFTPLSNRVVAAEGNISTNNTRIDLAHSRLDYTQTRLDDNTTRLDLAHSRLDADTIRIDTNENRINLAHSRLDADTIRIDNLYDNNFITTDIANSVFDAKINDVIYPNISANYAHLYNSNELFGKQFFNNDNIINASKSLIFTDTFNSANSANILKKFEILYKSNSARLLARESDIIVDLRNYETQNLYNENIWTSYGQYIFSRSSAGRFYFRYNSESYGSIESPITKAFVKDVLPPDNISYPGDISINETTKDTYIKIKNGSWKELADRQNTPKVWTTDSASYFPPSNLSNIGDILIRYTAELGVFMKTKATPIEQWAALFDASQVISIDINGVIQTIPLTPTVADNATPTIELQSIILSTYLIKGQKTSQVIITANVNPLSLNDGTSIVWDQTVADPTKASISVPTFDTDHYNYTIDLLDIGSTNITISATYQGKTITSIINIEVEKFVTHVTSISLDIPSVTLDIHPVQPTDIILNMSNLILTL